MTWDKLMLLLQLFLS